MDSRQVNTSSILAERVNFFIAARILFRYLPYTKLFLSIHGGTNAAKLSRSIATSKSGRRQHAIEQSSFEIVSSGCYTLITEVCAGVSQENQNYLHQEKFPEIMKREGFYLFANLFTAKGNVEDPQTFTDVTATSSAQPHVLREKMMEKQMTHGETVTANISPVRVESMFGRMHVYFCPMQTIDILEKLTPGDGGEIPMYVTVEGLTIPTRQGSGLYTLKNVKLSSNGVMQVTASEKTSWEVYS